jgi:hypothetical protein
VRYTLTPKAAAIPITKSGNYLYLYQRIFQPRFRGGLDRACQQKRNALNRIREAALLTSSRAITAEERATLLSHLGSPRSRRGIISHLAYYGAYLILIPVIAGGLAARVLSMMRVQESIAFPGGLALGLLVSALAFRVHRRSDRRARESWQHLRNRYQALDHVASITAHPRRGWPLSSATDWPAYLFEDADGSFLLIAAEEFALPTELAATDTMTVTLIPPENDIMSVTWAGGTIPLAPKELPFFHQDDDWPGDGQATVLERAALPRMWLEVIDAV